MGVQRERERYEGPSGRIYTSSNKCTCMEVNTNPRRAAIQLVEAWWFDPVVLVTILANCGTMAWESPLDPTGTWKQGFLEVCEWLFLAVFTIELLAKMLAYGLIFNKHAYLRDPWCQLDFVVVSLAWLPIIFPGFGNFQALRAFRALRPLRALKRLPGMPVLVQWILDVMPKMGSVVMLCGFIFIVFGIVGMELFKGVLHYRCALPGFELHELPSALPALGTSTPVALAALQRPYDTGMACKAEDARSAEAASGATSGGGANDGQCPAGTSCVYFEANPNDDVTSFDSVGSTLIILMQGITFDE